LAHGILSVWIGVSLYQGEPSVSHFHQAIEHEARNPEPYYGLGLFYFWDLHEFDLEKAFRFLKQALERNPLEQPYWLSVARVLYRKGDRTTADQALERAILVFPLSFVGRWQAGNLLLEGGRIDEAVTQFSCILSYYPEQSSRVYDLFLRVVRDPNWILQKLVPSDAACLTQYLSYVYGTGDAESAEKVWAKRKSLGYKPSRQETIAHIDYLLSQGKIQGAHQIWKERLQEEGIPLPSDGNLITNGSFETDQILGGGFDWRVNQVQGATVSYDTAEASEGKRSLRIDFDGKENVDYYHVYQYVSLRPERGYILKAHLKTRGVTTKSGLRIELVGLGSPFSVRSESLTGDNPWKELSIDFQTPSDVKGAIVRVRRERTDKFDRFLGGTLWLDHVRLFEIR